MVSKTRNKINFEYLGLIVLACFPVFPYAILSISLVLCLGFTLIEYCKSHGKKKKNDFSRRKILMIILFYIILLSSTLFHEKSITSLGEFQASIPILIFGISWYFFSSLSLSLQQIKNIFYAFIFSIFLLGCIIAAYSINISINSNLAFFNIVRITLQKITFLDLHPVYVSIYFIFSSFYLITTLKKNNKFFSLILIAFFTILILLIASRIAIITYLILLFFKFFLTKINKKSILIFVVFLIIFFIALVTVKPLQLQLNEISTLDKYELPNKKFPTSPQIRLGINKCSFEIIKENPIFGIGGLKFQNELEVCYEQYNNHDKIKYNSHNYYTFLMGSCGVLGLFAFVYSIILQFILARKLNNFMFICFTLIILLFSFTENILSRSHGVTFFVFCISIFLCSNKTSKES